MIVDVEVRRAPPKGFGVFARRPFRRGEFIFRRTHGRVVPVREIVTLDEDERRHLCELDRSRSAILVGAGRYLNHACDPNAMRSGVKVFARRAIERGEEITIDYRLNAYGGERFRCRCGRRPHEVVNSFFALAPSRQREYLPYAPAFIRREYRRRERA